MADRCLEPLPLWNSMSFLLKVDSCQQSQGICMVHGLVNKKHSFQTNTGRREADVLCGVANVGASRGLAWGGMVAALYFPVGFRDNASCSLIWHTAQLDVS